MRHGTRKAPSQLVAFSPLNGVVPPSGQVKHFGAVVGGVDDDGVVGDAEIVELLQQLADVPVGLDHAVGVEAEPGLALRLLLQMREDVHARGVEVAEERLVWPAAAA